MKIYIPHPLDVARGLTQKASDALYREKRTKTSNDLVTKARFFYQEKISDGIVSSVGHIRRFVSRPKDSLLTLSSTFLNIATTVIGNIAQENRQTLAETSAAFKAIFASSTLDIARDFIISTQKINADEALAINQQINYELDTVERIIDGRFIGPHPEDMHRLVNAFENAKLNETDFTKQALALKGVVFSQEHHAHALCNHRADNIRAQFNDIVAPEGPLRPVLVFRALTEHTPEQTQEVHNLAPSRQHGQTFGYPERIPVFA